MNRNFTWLVVAASVFLLAGAFVLPVASQTVNVTFTCNTSTNLDTLGEDGAMQIRGAIRHSDGSTEEGDILPGGGNISWSSASTLILENVGGDYWSGTFELFVGDTLTYKYFTDLAAVDGAGTFPDGWEGPFTDSPLGLGTDTRILVVGESDTTLPLQYYQPGGGTAPKVEFTAPFESKPDTVAVYFRVNLGGVTKAELFDPEVNGPVGIRGSAPVTDGGDWGQQESKPVLSREENSVNDGSFWSGVAYVPKDSINIGETQLYKFFIENNGGIDWEGNVNPDNLDGNREFTWTETMVNGAMDTTLHWVYFNNQAPAGEPFQSEVTFRVSTEALEGIGLFDRGVGDDIKVIGAKGWNRPDNFIDLTFIPALQEWATTEPFNVIPGTVINYKYFVVWDSSRVDSTSPNFIPGLSLDNGWEEPSAAGGGNRQFEFQASATQAPAGDFGFDRQFYASVPQNGWFANDIAVTFNVDMTNATEASQNSNTLFDPASDSVWVQMDGSLLALQQGFEVGGAGARVVRLTDPDQDMVYSGTWNIVGPGWYQLGFIIAYGGGSEVTTNGGGFESGRRYYQFIRPTVVNQDGSTEWPSEVSLATIPWVESNLPIETPPDLTQATSVADDGDALPKTFALEQNYPNPFNPETSIEYRVATASDVKIQVFNVVGQLVRTLVDERQSPGAYKVTWRGNNDRGEPVSTGLYFLKMKAADFNKVQKMTLLR